MNYFRENHCRLCSKTFCCANCRIRHEELFHNVEPECEICIYGRTIIKEVSVSLLEHIKLKHWPLHCVFCKKVFNTLDELVPHGKCPIKLECFKMNATPKTPIGERNDSSVLITPFYKSLMPEPQPDGTTLLGATSTPLFQKEDGDKKDKITPVNQSEIKHVYKSSLKLTGSSNLSDSKKSDRKVTFSETPSISEYFKRPKCLPLSEQITSDHEDSYVSVEDNEEEDEEIFKTPNRTSFQNDNTTDILCKENCYQDETVWETALTKLDLIAAKTPEVVCNQANNFNVSLQINIIKPTESEEASQLNSDDSLNKSSNIWSSMTSMVKSVMNNISFGAIASKRSLPESYLTDQAPSLKRMKLTELKCRPPIRELRQLDRIRFIRPRYVDKATQTDESFLNSIA